MMLWSNLGFLLDFRSNDDEPQAHAGRSATEFPSGQLTSSAWEGWWHDDA